MASRIKARPARYRSIGEAMPQLDWDTTIAEIAYEVERLVSRVEDQRARGASPDEYLGDLGTIKDLMAVLRGEVPTALTAPVASAAAPAAPPAAAFNLGDTVPDIKTILRGFSFTAHWPQSPEGPFATDWYPKSTTEQCANCHRLPLALPVGGNVRLVRKQLQAPPFIPGPLILNHAVVTTDDGVQVSLGHVDLDVRQGRAEANQVFAFVGTSALEFFDTALHENPSHVHVAWNSSPVPNWQPGMGNQPARDFFPHFGFTVELRDPVFEPGPMTYFFRRACGGMAF